MRLIHAPHRRKAVVTVAMTSEPYPQIGARLGLRRRNAAIRIPVGAAWGLTAGLAIGVAYYHWHYEGPAETITFAGAITLALVSALTLVSRRALFSIALVAALIAIIVVASDVKRRYIEMVLHAYDVVFYMTSYSTLSFLWVDHKGSLIALLAASAATIAIGRWLFRADPTRVPRLASVALIVLCSGVAFWASQAKGERRHTLFYWNHLYLSSFYASWSETLETLWRGQLIEALKSQAKPPFKLPATCEPAQRPPHIILIHQESVVPPSYFLTLGHDPSLDSFFTSGDGKLHRLRVETYGGASWLTEFSLLTGVSTYSFGGMRTFVQSLMQGKVHDTLPQSLTRCGYHNSVFYPVPKDFVSNGRFYAAVGMPEIFDFRAQGAKRYNERDHFYYGNALKNLDSRLSSSRQPTFTFLLTSATHLPYTYAYEPETIVPGGGPHASPEMSEYLRRLAMAKADYDKFRAELQRRFPNEQFLILLYGDHQPVATRTLLGFDAKLTAEDMKLSPESPGMLTYYRIDAINYTPPPMPDIETLDVPYLGAVLLEAARLPVSGAYEERLRLMALCNGRYYNCANKNEILGFHRRLIDSGFVEAR
ncbi:MAG: sulfatase-like hydrolase/transferase [Hyphomicrobium sp.]